MERDAIYFLCCVQLRRRMRTPLSTSSYIPNIWPIIEDAPAQATASSKFLCALFSAHL